MVLYVVNDEGDERQFHVGGSVPLKDIVGWDVKDVTEIQADGHELQRILSRISGIPVIEGNNVMSWFGDHAKFIYQNLK